MDAHQPLITTPETAAAEQARKEKLHADKQVVLAYKRVFATPSGQLVLDDLKKVFGWDRWEAQDTHDESQIARRCAAKGPIFHIEKQLRTVFKDGKPKRPISP